MITKAQGKVLLQIARDTLKEAFEHKTVLVPHSIRKSKELLQPSGVFVTILKNSQLRGSMGYPPGTYSLVDGVIRAARDAAFNDLRFKSVRSDELHELRIRIDVMSKLAQVKPTKQAITKNIRAGKHGVFVEYGPFKGLQLPEDAKKNKWTARECVQKALQKAGLAQEMWKDKSIKIYRFITQVIEEK